MIDAELAGIRTPLTNEHHPIVEPRGKHRGAPLGRDRRDDAEVIPVGIVGRLVAVPAHPVLVRPRADAVAHVSGSRDRRCLIRSAQQPISKRMDAAVTTEDTG